MIRANEYQIRPTIFPDGTSQVWQIPESLFHADEILITWEFQSEAEFMHLAQLKHLLDLRSKLIPFITLKIDYLPYGRQDKDISNESTFALFTFANLLNTLHFDEVEVLDPHSAKAKALINGSVAEFPVDLVASIFKKTGADFVCYPDHGAKEKYSELYDLPFICGEKIRDQLTGKITSNQLQGANIAGKNILIVDDICDGGQTFILLADALRQRRVDCVNLFVTHGIFSQGLRRLFDAGISRIFTAKGEANTFGNNEVYQRNEG